MEKGGKIWKNGRFSGRLRPDWGNTARAATAALGSIGLILHGSPSRPSFCVCGSTSINYIPTVKQCKRCSLQMGLEAVM